MGDIYKSIRRTGSKLFYPMKYPLVKRKYQKLKIHSIDDTLDKIINEKVSVSRYGDVEFQLMCMASYDTFQKRSDVLIERLKKILTDRAEGHIVCIPQEFAGLDQDTTERHKRYWRWAMGKYGAAWAQHLKFDQDYYSTSISRPYIKYLSKAYAEKWFSKWKTVWDARDILIIEGEKTRFGVGNNLLDNAKTIERIIAPSQNAFDKYNRILETAEQFGTDKLILMALGPTATILAYDLAKKGCWTIDIGNLDTEYVWYLLGTEKKVPIRGKSIYEVGGDATFIELEGAELEKYRAQIVARIL